MDNIEIEFEKFGLGMKKTEVYQGAEHYAKQFKKCSVLNSSRIGYSSSSEESRSMRSGFSGQQSASGHKK